MFIVRFFATSARLITITTNAISLGVIEIADSCAREKWCWRVTIATNVAAIVQTVLKSSNSVDIAFHNPMKTSIASIKFYHIALNLFICGSQALLI